jgi:hypothetical protein
VGLETSGSAIVESELGSGGTREFLLTDDLALAVLVLNASKRECIPRSRLGIDSN